MWSHALLYVAVLVAALPIATSTSQLDDMLNRCAAFGGQAIGVSNQSGSTIRQVGVPLSKCMAPMLSAAMPKLVKVVDVRRVEEFNAGHCNSAVNIPWDSNACWKNGLSDPACKSFVDKMTSLVDSKYTTEIFVYCVSGNRAGQVAKFLQGLQWTNTKLSPPVT